MVRIKAANCSIGLIKTPAASDPVGLIDAFIALTGCLKKSVTGVSFDEFDKLWRHRYGAPFQSRTELATVEVRTRFGNNLKSPARACLKGKFGE
jgi:hypothetical protein